MTLEYEVHNFDSKSEPRYYEAVYSAGDAILVKAVLRQRKVETTTARKPIFRWVAICVAWTPGQSGDDDWTNLCHLASSEIAVRDVIATQASEEDWLDAAHFDAEKLIDRARPFVNVLSAAMSAGGKRRGLKSAA